MVNLRKLVDNHLKAPKAFFEWCERQIPVYHWENKEKKIISSNREGGILVKKRLTKKTRLSFCGGFFPFAIILCSSKRIEIQSWSYWQDIKDGQEELEFRLTNIEVLTNNHHYKLYQFNDGRVAEGLIPNYSSLGGAYQNTKFFPNNWIGSLQKRSELRYIHLAPSMDFRRLPRIYKFRKEIEYCQKINAINLEADIIYQYADMRCVNMNWLKKNKAILKNSTRSFGYFKLKEEIEKRGGKLVEGIEYHLTHRDIRDIPSGVGLVSFQNWYLKNKIARFSDYEDYLSMLSEMDIPIVGKNRIMPTNFKKAHDDLVLVYNQWKQAKKAEEEKKKNLQYEKRLKELLELETQIGDFLFVVPHSLSEIVKEGAELHHCVATYIDRHFTGKTTIIFVRAVDVPDKPLYTLEVNKGKLVQIRGKYNASPSKEANEAAKQFVEWTQKVA